MTPALCGLFKLLSSDSLGTEYNLILDNSNTRTNMYGLSYCNDSCIAGLFKLLSSDSLGTAYI